ncbi:DUF5677 domain-containing protein [Nocardioides lianchengensis]|uniref:Uncharacterized protein n=1 Tax=Nocardioides lianchengensis TaxID=1045774 RepID=A0A1G6XB07_9ACTN|nr:DUF5677 domain-containing protein [Nocardioides lianchengensis]NYG09028.1 hypothetical protein [Nocardioides lianchengensis]SDD75399.1 hypothetical protein SAMN05421872_110231 [Nocardioides lianchengensis]
MVDGDLARESHVPVEAYRAALQKLLVGWRMQASKGVNVPAEKVRVALLICPWVAQVHRFGQAYLRLEKNDLGHEGIPLVRSALEHALLAHWVAVTGDPGVVSRYAEDGRLLNAMLNEAKGRPRDVTASTWNLALLEELIADRQVEVVDDQKVLQKLDQICERLGLRNTVYPAYRVLSWYAHPTTHSAELYVEEQEDGTFALRNQPSGPAPAMGLSMLTHCVYWARRVLDDLTVGHPYEKWLDSLADSVQVMRRLPDPQP